MNIALSGPKYTHILTEQTGNDSEHATCRSKAASPGKGFNVLLVDDDTDILECYRMLFELEGYHIEAASTPVEAIEKAKENRFDLAILDYKLPNMRGDELALRLLEANGPMKFVFISGQNDAKESITNRGLNISYFMKPVDPERLLGAVRTAFNGGEMLAVTQEAVATA